MNDLLFEVSWEVCNKVGGIYAVLSTKANVLKQKYGDGLIFVGPDLWKDGNESPFFKESKTLLRGWKEKVSLPCGIKARVGRWLAPGEPIAVLISFDGVEAEKDMFYGKMWELFGVDSLHGYGDYDESCMFALASGMVIESIARYKNVKGSVLAHFDEWTTGMGLLYLKWKMPEIATVFTTHATSIGRSICGNGKQLYDYMHGYHGDQMAEELNMQSKHSLEKAAAHNADVFTTVSDVTRRECVQLIEREPLVTPNAFEQEFVPVGIALTNVRAKARKVLLDVAEKLTGIKLGRDTFIVGTSGRCEYRNKGLDVYLDALSKVRQSRRSDGQKILAFVFVPSWVKGARADLQKNLREGKAEKLDEPIITHELHSSDGDCILNKIRWEGFANRSDDKVLVIYVPCYLNGDDGIFNLSYYDLLPALDATVFASYYEPWGYTPLESIAFGVPTITSNLAGFGQWVKTAVSEDMRESGVCVIHRTDSNYAEAVADVSANIMALADMDNDDRKKLSRNARATSRKASWENFIKYYYEAYDKAIENNKKK